MPPLTTAAVLANVAAPAARGRAMGVCAAVALLASLQACDRAPLLVQPGSPAPAFTLTRLEGRTVEFPRHYQGKVVALRFWADWCPYCRSEMQALEPVYRRYRERGLTYLAVNVMQPRGQVEAFVREVGVSAEVLLDGDGQVTRAFGVMGLPVTVFVDREGIVRSRIVGESTAETFGDAVESLLGQSQ